MQKVCCTCKVVVLLVKPLLLLSLFFDVLVAMIASLDLKAPFNLTNSALFSVTAEHRNSYLLLELRSVNLVPVE